MARSDDDKAADTILAIRLLASYDVNTTRAKVSRGGQQEKRERAALARLVRDSMKGFPGELLALAIDPQTPSNIPGMYPTCKISFNNRSTGKWSTWARDLAVLDCIRAFRWASPRRPKLEAAYAEACAQFNIKPKTAQAIWLRHQKMIKGNTSK